MADLTKEDFDMGTDIGKQQSNTSKIELGMLELANEIDRLDMTCRTLYGNDTIEPPSAGIMKDATPKPQYLQALLSELPDRLADFISQLINIAQKIEGLK